LKLPTREFRCPSKPFVALAQLVSAEVRRALVVRIAVDVEALRRHGSFCEEGCG
jgi:hypothetical protein